MQAQYTSQILMVRPSSFQFNSETAASNLFQKKLKNITETQIQQIALNEFDTFVSTLRQHKIEVTVIEDTAKPIKPDAVFPNNWISSNSNGEIVLYPMCTANRRLEVRSDILDFLKEKFMVSAIIDLRDNIEKNRFLEGTGSIIFDHLHGIAYACISPRTNLTLFNKYCNQIGYTPIAFNSVDMLGKAVYHTNVMLSVGDKFAVVCLESITDATEKKWVIKNLEQTGHEIIDISFTQMNAFVGNMLQVENVAGKTYLIMSETAFKCLHHQQIVQIKQYTEIISVAIPTIETIGGGSARCMMAELFLDKKQ